MRHKYPAFACAALAALPALMAPSLAEQEASSEAELLRASMTRLTDAAEVLNSPDTPIDKAFKISILADDLNELTEARDRACPGERTTLDAVCEKDEEMRQALRQFTEAMKACTARGFENSPALHAAMGEFIQAISRM